MGFKKAAAKDTKATPGTTAPSPDNCNIVHLAGTIQVIKMNENSAFALIDPGNTEGKYVPCTLYGEADAELADKLDGFQKGDVIKIIGYLRPWSQKVDDKWQNKMEVRITEIKSAPPKREASGVPTGWHNSDDIPF